MLNELRKIVRKKFEIKRGDTLIEVTLAIGIFSLIAVGVVSVVSGSTSRAQVALEQTLAREEIDAQAEALRFIQSSYINSKTFSEDPDNSDYTDIWHTITAQAKNKMQVTDDLLKFQPTTCDELYEENYLSNQGAFIINTRKLSSHKAGDIVLFSKDAKLFHPSPTYPHLVYGLSAADDPLLEGNVDADSTLARAEGIYIIGIKDPDSTNIVDHDNTRVSKKAAFYDFYIRACWYRPGAETPTTISTVMRLYDPDAIEVGNPDPIDPTPTPDPEPDPDPEPEVPKHKIIIKTSPGIQMVSLNGRTCVTPSGCAVENLSEGVSYELKAQAVTGYTFKNWTVSPEGGIKNLSQMNTTYTVGAHDATIVPTAVPIPSSYIVTIKTTIGIPKVSLNGVECTSTSGCSVTGLTPGTKYNLVATLNSGFRFSRWATSGKLDSYSATSTQFTMGSSNYTIEPITYLQYMQDIASLSSADKSAYIASLKTGEVFQLKDNRDERTYNLAKLKDGRVWMAQDLSFGWFSHRQTNPISSSDTNISSSLNLSTLDSNNCSTYSKGCYTGHFAFGGSDDWVIYNFCAASGTSVCSNTYNSNAQHDLCPAGWRIPTGGNTGEMMALYNIYRNRITSPISSDGANFKMHGTFDQQGNGSYGTYWTSTRATGSSMYSLRITGSGVNASYSFDRKSGASIRCIVK